MNPLLVDSETALGLLVRADCIDETSGDSAMARRFATLMQRGRIKHNPTSDGDGNGYTHGYSNGNGYGYGYGDGYGDGNGDGYNYGNGNGNGNSNGDGYGDGYGYGSIHLIGDLK